MYEKPKTNDVNLYPDSQKCLELFKTKVFSVVNLVITARVQSFYMERASLSPTITSETALSFCNG